MKRRQLFILSIFILLVFTTCEKKVWDNPYDSASLPESWMPKDFVVWQGNSQSSPSYDDFIKMTWKSQSDNIDGYIIKRSINNGGFNEIATISTATEFVDQNITEGGKLHKYLIQAKAGNNKSPEVESAITPILLSVAQIEFSDLSNTSVKCNVVIKEGGSVINYHELTWSKYATFEEISGKYSDWSDPGNSFSRVVPLDDNTTYYFKAGIQSDGPNRDREMSNSNIFSVTTPKTTHVTWNADTILSSFDSYFSLHEFENLTIGDNVEIINRGTSQVIFKITGTLTLGKNTTIKVRNGYYENSPLNKIEDIIQINPEEIYYPNTFGKGGDGGDGIGIGGGGGGGFGGGIGGYYESFGNPGKPNGGDGGASSISSAGGAGGNGSHVGNHGGAASGGGGNSGNGGSYTETSYGGGGGGYGGGVLVIIANKIEFIESYPPKFLVSEQIGGIDGHQGSQNGENGQGGLLIINCSNYTPSSQHYNLNNNTIGIHETGYFIDNGHGVITGNPEKVFINGVLQ